MPVSAVATAREWDDTDSFSSFSGSSFSSGPKSSTYKKEKKGPRDPFLPRHAGSRDRHVGIAAGVTYYVIDQHDGGPSFSLSAERAEEAVQAVVDECGSDVHEIRALDYQMTVVTRAKDNPDHWDEVVVQHRYHKLTNDGAASIQPEENEYFDATQVDWDVIMPGMVDEAMSHLPEGDLGDLSTHVTVTAIDEHTLERNYWREDFPMPRDLEKYDAESFEFFHDITPDEGRPVMEKMIAAAPLATVRIYLGHDYGHVSLTGNTDGEILDIATG